MNPWLSFLKLAGPWIVASGVGFSAAWWVQGVRLDDAKNEFAEYKTEQQRQALIWARKQEEQREVSRKEYEGAKKRLQAEIDSHETFRRCVAAGKCGGMQPQPSDPGLRLPSGPDLNGSGGGSVPAPGGRPPEVIADCANVQLRMNKLQSAIKAQPGYIKSH